MINCSFSDFSRKSDSLICNCANDSTFTVVAMAENTDELMIMCNVDRISRAYNVFLVAVRILRKGEKPKVASCLVSATG